MKRRRVKPVFLWGDGLTAVFMDMVVKCVKDSPESFERPTAQRFYEKLAIHCTKLQEIPWTSMRDKMRNCKKLYIAANTWKQQTNGGLVADDKQESVVDYMQRKCPHYDALDQIFGRRKSIKFEDISCNDYDESPIITPLTDFSPGDESECSFGTDHSLSVSCEDANQTLEELPRTSDCFAGIGNNVNNKRKRIYRTTRWSDSVTLDLIMMVQESVKDSPDLFEKPTAQRFYERLATGCPQLEGISWTSMRDKIRYCKKLYKAAKRWKQQTSGGLMADDKQKSVVDYMQRKCPHYDALDQLFGQQKSIKIEEIVCNDDDHLPIITPMTVFSPGDGSEFSFTTDHSLSDSCEHDNQTLAELPRSSANFASIGNNANIKRKRVNASFRWADSVTVSLLKLVLESVKDSPESFERPTAQRFYVKLATGCTQLEGIPWKSMRDKIKNCKKAYIAANTWKQQTDDGLMADDKGKSVLDYTQIKCPHYDMLHQIFGQEKSIKFEEVLCNDYDESPIITPLAAFPQGDESEYPFNTDHCLSVSCEDANQTLEEFPPTSDCFAGNDKNTSKKCKRVDPTFRWGDGVTVDFLNMVVEYVKDSPESFEKLNRQQFYERLANGCSQLEEISWKCFKCIMRVLRKSYIEANKWKQQMGACLMADGDVDYLKTICPHYDELHQIFGQRKNINPCDIIQSTDMNEEYLCSDNDEIDTDQSFNFPHENSETPDESSSAFSSFRIMEQKIKLDREKFEWQKKKDLKELKYQFKLKQMELEQNERLRKLEIKYKYSKQNEIN